MAATEKAKTKKNSPTVTSPENLPPRKKLTRGESLGKQKSCERDGGIPKRDYRGSVAGGYEEMQRRLHFEKREEKKEREKSKLTQRTIGRYRKEWVRNRSGTHFNERNVSGGRKNSQKGETHLMRAWSTRGVQVIVSNKEVWESQMEQMNTTLLLK